MMRHQNITEPDDFFIELNKRPKQAVYFYRVDSYAKELEPFFIQYYQAARATGMVFEEKIANPTKENLLYYQEMLGNEFTESLEFIVANLRKWIPGLADNQREALAASIYQTLLALRQEGKNDNIIRNAYIKFMCWLYYKCRWMLPQLGKNLVPKILYQGSVSSYELAFLKILSNTGCDVIILELEKDSEEAYQKIDPASTQSDRLSLSKPQPFPDYFNVKWMQEEVKKELSYKKLYGTMPEVKPCTNVWMEGSIFKDIRKPMSERGSDSSFFYNSFCRMCGVEDKYTYQNELYQLQFALKKAQTRMVIINDHIEQPAMEEIAAINRKQYQTVEQLLQDLSLGVKGIQDCELQRLMRTAFLDVMIAESRKPGQNINKLTGTAVYLLCWLRRYQHALFEGWHMPKVSCFLYMGNCKNSKEALFLKMIAKLPVDVVIFQPDLQEESCLQDGSLYEEHYAESLVVTQFPTEEAGVEIGTAAYHAERELQTMLHQDTGIYKNQQYAKANTIRLQTMYEEIAILWQEEVRYRPNFSTVQEIVNVPVLCAKVSGVKDHLVREYWQMVQELITDDTFVIKNAPYIERGTPNPMQGYASLFFKNGKLVVPAIKQHEQYPYAVLREEMQNHMLSKLQLLIDQKLIKGTFENGTEYTIVATILNLPKEIVRLIQKFDFTKKNPKLIYIHTGENMISLEDSIMVAFLHLIGFDIVFFVPTGYQNIEKHFNKRIFDEHQIGEYVYDLQVPDFSKDSLGKRGNIFGKLFRKGR